MMATISRIRFRDQGLALSVTAGLHIALIAWLCTVEMYETLAEPKPKTIQLQFVQIPPPAKQQPESKKPEPMVEEKVVNKPAPKKQKEMPAEAQQKTQKKFVESQSNKTATTAKKQSQQVVTEEQSTTIETKLLRAR